VTGIEPVAC